MAVMTHRSEIVSILILLSACGEDGGMTTVSTTNPSTATLTQSGTSNGMTEDSSGTTTGKTTEVTSDTTSTPPTSGTTSEDGGPVFLSFSTNVGKITQGESVTFTALLTDPDGLDDIVGGSLLSEDEKIDFGPLIAAGQPGTYSISLSWAQIHQSDPISFENAQPARVFRARFFDQKGNQAASDAEILLTCAGGSACAGFCTDIDLDGMNCGSCSHACASMGCQGGSCAPNLSGCFEEMDGLDSCSAICASFGEACAESECMGFTVEKYGTITNCLKGSAGIIGSEPCDKIQSWANPAIKCCCTDSN
jgi:hypothetical protein